MPRGRHRHSPPLHRLLPPSAIAGVSVVCALAPWVFTEPLVLRGLAAAAAATAVVGAVVMRRWDTQAGKQVADLTRARASDEWRHEERVAELESDLDESRELRVKLEQRLRAKRTELAGLRNEHASLLRRYATAETERASVLEERRVLEIEAATPARALPPVPVAAKPSAGTVKETADAAEVTEVAENAGGDAEVSENAENAEDKAAAPAVFSPEGSRLFLRAKEALARFDDEAPVTLEADGSDQDGSDQDGSDQDGSDEDGSERDAESSKEPEGSNASKDSNGPKGEFPKDDPPKNDPPKGDAPSDGESVKAGPGATEVRATEPAGTGESEKEPALEDDAQGKPEAVDGHERAAAITPAGTPTPAAQPALPAAQQPSGHFIAPTAVAVVPATPARRPAVEGDFDFFGTKKGAAPSALESVQNEDLADVVGQEALALHKAEAEAEFKPADEESRGIGQVIDLTAHDETEQIDVQGLRSAVS